MKHCLLIQVALLIMINVAFGAVGDGSVSGGLLPAGAPTPPDINSESLVLPDYNLYKPSEGQMTQSSYSGYAAQGSYPGYPAQAGYSTSCITCASSAALTGGVSGSYPCQGSYPASSSLTTPYGYAPQSYQAIYPSPSICRCNEYYVQLYPGRLGTVAGVYCGRWLPLWSKVSRPGVYWSFEWVLCGNPGYYCPPEVRNFGCKNTGWFQSWFVGNTPGWHVLSYYCNDWSNYIYIYVWPAS